jgi:transcriptional regulator with XRE-family HTH domain
MKGNIEPEQLEQARLTVGAWLKEKRTEKGLSQSGLARMMGIDQATVNKVEAGKWAISVDMLALFCEHLEYPITELFKLDNENDQLHTA